MKRIYSMLIWAEHEKWNNLEASLKQYFSMNGLIMRTHIHRIKCEQNKRGQCMTFRHLICSCVQCLTKLLCYLSHERAAKAQPSLRICADSPELSLLAYTQYGYRWKLRQNLRILASSDTSVWAFISGICACAIRTEISCTVPNGTMSVT